MVEPYIIYTIPLVLAAVISLYLAITNWSRKRLGVKTESFMLLAIVIWTIATALEVIATNLHAKIVFDIVSFLGISTIPTIWFVYVLQFTYRERRIAQNVLIVLSLVPIFLFLLTVTNDSHRLLWDIQFDPVLNAHTEIPKTYNIGLIIFSAYAYLISAAGIAILFYLVYRTRRLYRWQATVLILACTVAIVVNFLDMYGLVEVPTFDITAASLVITVPIIVWLLNHLRVGDILHVAQSSIIDSMSDSVIVLDASNGIIDINRTAEQVIGKQIADVVGQPISLVWPNWVGFSERILFDIERGIELVDKDEDKHYEMRISPLLDWRKVLISKTVVIRDITKRKKAEQEARDKNLKLKVALVELQQAQDKLVKQERLAAFGELSEGLAHGYSNALAPIILDGESILNEIESSRATSKEKVERILEQVKHAALLTTQISDFSRSSFVNRVLLDINTFMDETLPYLKLLCPENIQLTIKHWITWMLVAIDRPRLRVAIINLIQNAVDSMPEGGGIHIRISRVNSDPFKIPSLEKIIRGPWVKVEISDTGIGIQPEDFPHLFEPFFTTKGPESGKGMGLAQSYGIIKQHDGHIEIDSQPGEGTTVTIYLPISYP